MLSQRVPRRGDFTMRHAAQKGPVMAEPIVFVKYDSRPGKEALVLIYRPDSATTRGEKQLVMRASSLAADAVSELGNFIDVARPIVEETGRAVRQKPTLHRDLRYWNPIGRRRLG